MTGTRCAVLADVHGNLPALQTVLDDVDEQSVDALLVAGDLVGGPLGDEVVDLLHARAARMIIGNNEEYLLALRAGQAEPARLTARQWAFTRACYERSRPDTLDRLAALPAQLSLPGARGRGALRMVHGSPARSTEPLHPDRDRQRLCQVLEQIPEPALVCAHTHESFRFEHAGRLAVNPGAVGGACNGDPRAQYAVLSWRHGSWHVEHRALDYDLDVVRRLFVDSGFLDAAGPMARAQLEGIYFADRTMGDLVRHARKVAEGQGLGQVPCVPDHVWELAVDTFAWRMPPP